jgi:hypothetical protein
MRNSAVAVLLLFLSGTAYTSDIEYKPLNNIEIVTYEQKTISIPYKANKYIVDLEFYSQDNEYRFSEVEGIFKKASQYVFEFAEKEKSYRSPECTPKKNLEVYDVDWSVLNNNVRFAGVHAPTNLSSVGIQGLYDPRISDYGVSSITITGHNKNSIDRAKIDKEILIAHEVAHYWYDRLCFNEKWDGSVEGFAIKFEAYYLKRTRR